MTPAIEQINARPGIETLYYFHCMTATMERINGKSGNDSGAQSRLNNMGE